MLILKCEICGFIAKSKISLTKHLKDHSITPEEYYLQYIEKHGTCIECASENVTFINIHDGYKTLCSTKCIGIRSRRIQKQNPEKETNFRAKISKAVSHEWATKDQSERILNMTTSIKILNSKLSTEEKKEKFGYLNKLSTLDREVFIKNMLLTGAHRWWKLASDDEKCAVYLKRNESIRATWDIRGHEIMYKQLTTFMKNRDNPNSVLYILTDEQYELMSSNLQVVFNI